MRCQSQIVSRHAILDLTALVRVHGLLAEGPREEKYTVRMQVMAGQCRPMHPDAICGQRRKSLEVLKNLIGLAHQ